MDFRVVIEGTAGLIMHNGRLSNDPSHIREQLHEYANIHIVEHNIATDPLDQLGSFDLIHARLVLGHLPNRGEVLHRLAAALNPSGVLVIEEFATSWDRCVMATPDPAAHRLFEAYHTALQAVLQAAGVDTGWGLQVHSAMQDAGLDDVDAELWARAWRGGEPGAMLAYHAAGQLRPSSSRPACRTPDLDRFRELLLDPQLVTYGNLAVSTSGHSPMSSGKLTGSQREPEGRSARPDAAESGSSW